MRNAEILIKILKSLMFDGWKLKSDKTVTETKKQIEKDNGKTWLTFIKDNHEPLSIEYSISNCWYGFLTSWHVQYYDYKKEKKTLTRLVESATNKQVRSFLTRLDKVQEYKALDYKKAQARKEKQEMKRDWIANYMKENCVVTWKDIQASVESFKEIKQAILDKVSELNKEYAETVDGEVQRYADYKKAVSFTCDVYHEYISDGMTDWKEYYEHYLEDRIYWDTKSIKLVTDQDFTDLAKHILNVQEQTASLIPQLENMLKTLLKTKATWNKAMLEAEEEHRTNNNY